ncbi:MAG: carboxypeptidase-like regulatory domain-containing protein [Bacteroidales bacterium]|nr:carboxypeptidase-like regulatory domain-containing protein [Bacteroidales bacterium]
MNIGKRILSEKTFQLLAAIIFLLAAGNSLLWGQDNVFEQNISIKMNGARIRTALEAISRKTGYVFTYDSDLIKPETIISVDAEEKPVSELLDEIFHDRDFSYSVIDNHLIIYKKIDETTLMIREEGKTPVYLVTGSIIESGNSNPLPFATIGIYNKGVGTISNYDGNFSLKITPACLNDSITVSCLGFKNRIIPVNQAIGNNYIIELKRDYVPIPEVIIRTRDPLELILGIRRHISENYGATPVILTAFYRESISKRNKLQLYSEAVINIYKSAYVRTLKTDQLSVFKSRKMENINIRDTLLVKLQSGLDACLALDGIKNRFDFINAANVNDYNYRMTDIINIDNEVAYVIDFEQVDEIVDLPLFQGSIFINTYNYGVHSAEFEVNPDYIDKLDRIYVRKNTKGYTVKPLRIKYKIDYRYVNNRFYLNHVRGDLEFNVRKKRKLFGSNYYVFFEMVVTKIDSVNVARFKKDKISPSHLIFSETINDYDPDFWGTDNYMKPEDNIRESLNRISIRLGKYIKRQ